MSECFELDDTESLNQLLLIPPFCKENGTTSSRPQIRFQVNIFACGGLAVGVSSCHKITDANTTSTFLKSWAALFSGSPNNVTRPDLSLSSSLFPQRVDLPHKYLAFMDDM